MPLPRTMFPVPLPRRRKPAARLPLSRRLTFAGLSLSRRGTRPAGPRAGGVPPRASSSSSAAAQRPDPPDRVGRGLSRLHAPSWGCSDPLGDPVRRAGRAETTCPDSGRACRGGRARGRRGPPVPTAAAPWRPRPRQCPGVPGGPARLLALARASAVGRSGLATPVAGPARGHRPSRLAAFQAVAAGFPQRRRSVPGPPTEAVRPVRHHRPWPTLAGQAFGGDTEGT